MSISPLIGGPDHYAALLDAATKQALTAYHSAAAAKPTTDAAPAQNTSIRHAEADVMNKVSQSLLARYCQDTGNSQASLSQMEADASGFAKAKSELSAQAPGDARTIDAVARTLSMDHDVAMAEAAAEHEHASPDAIKLAGLLQLVSDFKAAGTPELPADIAAFASQSPLVQQMIASATPGEPNTKVALAQLRDALSSIAGQSNVSGAMQNAVSYTVSDINNARGTPTNTDIERSLRQIQEQDNEMQKEWQQLTNEGKGAAPFLEGFQRVQEDEQRLTAQHLVDGAR